MVWEKERCVNGRIDCKMQSARMPLNVRAISSIKLKGWG